MMDRSQLINAAKSIQKPVSLAALFGIVLYLIFHEIVGKIKQVDQTILPSLVNWIGSITLVAVVLSICSYIVPFFVRARVGTLKIGAAEIKDGSLPSRPIAGKADK